MQRRVWQSTQWPLDGGDVIALTLDGIGMGENGALWGGECLRVNYRECEHLGGLPAVALPGGDLAAKQPWRNLLAQCLRFVPEWQNYSETASVQQQNWSVLARAIERGINAPLASSCGRLFDAVAAALGCAPATLSYEGEAACALEALAASVPRSDASGDDAAGGQSTGSRHFLAAVAELAGTG